jgi:hypothetical protein
VTATATTSTAATATKLTTALHDEERAARKVHLLLSEKKNLHGKTVMDRTSWNKMLRSIYTN